MSEQTAPHRSDDGRSTRWREHNEARRAAIIDAAIRVLEQQQPGDDLALQAVADAAGMSRTVLYRHFEDRIDLDRAVQREVCDRVGAALAPEIFSGAQAEEVVRRVIAAFVGWSVEHPALLWFAERDLPGWGPGPMDEAMAAIAVAIEEIMRNVLASLGVDLDETDRAGLDPWVFGMITAVFAAVRRWLARGELNPGVDAFVGILHDSIWLQISGLATSRGIHLPELPIGELVAPLGGER